MKIEYPLYDCIRTHGEIKIFYNANWHKYTLCHCVATYPKEDIYPISFSKEDLIENGLRKILNDYQEVMSDVMLSDYFDGYCTNVCYMNISDKINCRSYKWMNIQDIRLDIGDKCNLKCKMCPYAQGRIETPESEEALKFMLDNIIDSGLNMPLIQSSEISESTVYDWFLDYVKRLKKTDCNIFNIHTNGLKIIDRNVLDSLLNESEVKVMFNLSIDAITPETYYDIRQVDIFDKLIETAQYLNSINRLNAIFYVPSKWNKHEWEYVKDYYANIGLGDKLLYTKQRFENKNSDDNIAQNKINVINDIEVNPL